MSSQTDTHSESPFWVAVCSNDVNTAKNILENDSSLASKDFHVEKDRDSHTDGFPLHKACAAGHEEIAKLLLDRGADVDAKSPTEWQKELGMPIWRAVNRRNDSLANLLLDHGAEVGAYALGQCDNGRSSLRLRGERWRTSRSDPPRVLPLSGNVEANGRQS